MRICTRRIIRLVILLVLALVSCAGCRQSPLLEKIIYKNQAKQINLANDTKPKNNVEENKAPVAQQTNEQIKKDNKNTGKANTDQQGVGQADAQQGKIQQGTGDTGNGTGDESSDVAVSQVVGPDGVQVPKSVANVTTVMESPQNPHVKSSWTSDRSKYDGKTKNGMFDDPHGTYSWADGDKYTGGWIADFMEGPGICIWANGDEYEGGWKDNQFNGQGTYTWASGSSYTGEFKDGVREGQGTYTWANGDKYVGGWKSGVKFGQGTYTWADGSIYTGEWNSDREGRGTYKGADGTIYEGPWKRDEFVAK